MIIYPDIELRDGKCVNLIKGDHANPKIYQRDPVDAAREFVAAGGNWLHVVDLDVVFHTGDNSALVEQIVAIPGASVQIAGGIRSINQVRQWVEMGASRVVIATAAVKNPAFVIEAALAYPDQVVVSIDCRAGKVVVDGWRESTIFSPVEFAGQFADSPLAAFIYTDVDREIDGSEDTLSNLVEFASGTQTPVIASGMVQTIEDISRIKYLPNIAGVITGRALFGHRFTLEEAIAIGAEPMPATAPFV